MSEHLTSDEGREPYVATMGKDLGGQFHRLYNECMWLHLKWNEYVALFGVSQSRWDILNASASGFFVLLDDALWRDLIVHLCTLTDTPGGGQRRRLTVRRLPALVEPAIQEQVERLVSVVVDKTEFARDWRNRHIAHRDLKLALAEGAKPLPPASRQDVIDALSAIVAVLGAVEEHYRKSRTGYEYVSHLGDAETLLHVLRDGVEAQNEWLRRLETGEHRPEDFKPKPPI